MVAVSYNNHPYRHAWQLLIDTAQGSGNENQTLLELVTQARYDDDYQRKREAGSEKGIVNLRKELVSKALKLLHELHDATIKEYSEKKNEEPQPIYEGRYTLITLALLDFLCYAGIFPFLSAGVGLLPEQRSKSVLKVRYGKSEEKLNGRGHEDDGKEILLLTVEGLLLLLRDRDEGVAPIVQERCLADLVAGLCELVLGPKALHESENLERELDAILERYAAENQNFFYVGDLCHYD